MATSISVTLGKTLGEPKVYEIRVAPRGVNSAWRQDVLAHLTELFNIFRTSGLGSILNRARDNDEDAIAELRQGRITISNIGAIANAAEQLVREIGLAPDWCYAQVLAYAPAIALDKEWVNNNATDEEVIIAFISIVKDLVLPLGLLTSLSGLVSLQTSTNLPSANGTSLTQEAVEAQPKTKRGRSLS